MADFTPPPAQGGKKEWKPNPKDTKGRQYEVYRDKRFTEIATGYAMLRDKADGTKGKVGTSDELTITTKHPVRFKMFRVNEGSFRFIVEAVTDPTIEP